MAIYRGDGGAGDATNDITINQITELSSEAQASATAAASSATDAETSASEASTSATNAANSATSAGTSATNAASSASSASTSASNASTSETNAAASETAAAASEAAAALSETAAAASETNAASSASSASTSASTATTQATSAATSATNAATSASAASTSETNAATSETNAATSETNAASSATSASTDAATATTKASEASTSASNAATSETNAAASESAAATSATNASTSETNAAASETAAASSASAAATSETNAATSASGAATSASSAATSASNASASADAALSALDNFDDRYLGQKTSDPTTDNDGDALVAGALYFNTTSDVMKVYEGSTWVAAYASLAGALLASNNLSDLDNVSTARTNLGLGTAATTASTDYVAVTGDTMTGNLSFGDSDKAIFGAGSDLQIFHDGSVSKIAGPSVFRISSNDGSRGSVQISAPNSGTGGEIRSVTYGNNFYLDSDDTYKQDSTAIGGSLIEMTATNANYGEFYFKAKQDPDSGGAVATRMAIDSSGNVGIGTSSPSNKLGLGLTSGATTRLLGEYGYNESPTFEMGVGQNDSFRGGMRIAVTDTGASVVGDSVVSFHTTKDGVGTVERVTIDEDGNVGIGTTSPTAILHTRSTAPVLTADGSAFSSSSNGTGFGIYRSASGRAAGYTWTIENAISAGGSSASDYQTDNLLFKGRASVTDATLTEHMRITNTGRVGIGTSSPAVKFQVSEASTDFAGLIANSTASGNGLKIQAGDNSGDRILQLDDKDGNEKLRVTSTGNLNFDSGYGSAATAYGVRAWVNFNGTGTVSIYDSGNVSSITDLGSGKYTVNFSTAMTDLNYAVVLGASTDSATTNRILHENNLNRSTASCDVSSCALGGSEQDEDRINVAIIR